LFHRPLVALATVCAEVVVVIAPNAPEPALPAAAVPVRVVRDELLHEGPLVAAGVGLAAATAPFALLAAGDMPGLRHELLALLLGRSAGGADAVALVDGNRWRPLPSLVRVAPARVVAARLIAAGERRLRGLVGELRLETIPEVEWRAVDPEGDWQRDVDVPADLPPDRGS
jgi:molybdopterin-guanine dinucleotide biosynthesis protein A